VSEVAAPRPKNVVGRICWESTQLRLFKLNWAFGLSRELTERRAQSSTGLLAENATRLPGATSVTIHWASQWH
jgi:hypothetical protein